MRAREEIIIYRPHGAITLRRVGEANIVWHWKAEYFTPQGKEKYTSASGHTTAKNALRSADSWYDAHVSEMGV